MPTGIYFHKHQTGFYKGHPDFISLEARKRISKANKGKKRSEESKKKMSEAGKGKHYYWKGKKRPPFSDETKRKMSEAIKGNKHYNWIDGRSGDPYPREFNAKLKLKIRMKYNFVCCLCGRTEREELEELNRVLCVNHKNFNKKDCREENLNVLCIRCNVGINRQREYYINYFNN